MMKKQFCEAIDWVRFLATFALYACAKEPQRKLVDPYQDDPNCHVKWCEPESRR